MPRSAALAVAATVALLMAAVGGSSTSAGAGETARPRPAGPSAAFSDISGGNGVFLGDPIPVDLKRAGYVEHEYAASGTATSYTQTSPLAEDGRWSFAPDGNVLGSMNDHGLLHLWRAPSWEEIEAKEKESRRDERK